MSQAYCGSVLFVTQLYIFKVSSILLYGLLWTINCICSLEICTYNFLCEKMFLFKHPFWMWWRFCDRVLFFYYNNGKNASLQNIVNFLSLIERTFVTWAVTVNPLIRLSTFLNIFQQNIWAKSCRRRNREFRLHAIFIIDSEIVW